MDAHSARINQEPIRARVLLRVVLLILLILIFWSTLAKIDEVTRGEAKVVPSRQIQIIQSLDGGIVSEILVREGQIVEEGQLLVRIDPTRFVSSFREKRAQYLAFLAKAERLAALAEDRKLQMPEAVVVEAPDTAQQEGRLYDAGLAELNNRISIAEQQLQQRQQELVEVQALNKQTSTGYKLAAKELAATEPLVASGAVSEVEVLRLQREVSRLRGERDQSAAQITRIRAALEEENHKIGQVKLDFRNDVRTDLAETMARLNTLSEGNVGLEDKVKQADVKSPVRGTVKRLFVNTVGGVVLPGHDIIEIVPLDDTLLLEAKISPRDIAFLVPGQKAMVKFTAYDYIVYGGLDAIVESIGADTISDDKGNAFYLVKVRTHQPGFGTELPIIPGMIAEVDIITGRKSIFAYLIKPVLKAKQYALTER